MKLQHLKNFNKMKSPYRKIKRKLKVKVKPAVVLPELPAAQQAQEMVGSDWFNMSAYDQYEFTKQMQEDGLITEKFSEGGEVKIDTPEKLWNNMTTTMRMETLKEFLEMKPNDPLYDFTINKIRKLSFLPYEALAPRFQASVEQAVKMGWGGKVMAEGGVAEKVKVSFTMGDGSVVVKTYDSKADSDEGIADFMIENDVTDVKVEEEKKKSLADIVKKTEKKGAKGKEKEAVDVDGYEGDIAEYKRLNEKIKMLTADKELIGGKLKSVGKEKFLELYEEKRRTPDNFLLRDGDEQILFMVQDKYIKVTPEKEAMLDNYGKGLVETVTTYKFTDLIEKKLPNGQTIGEVVVGMIMDNKMIPDMDKMNLITAEVVTRIPKGTIDRLMEYKDPAEVFTLIEPITALK
jgi:hypothetical protein